jgi:multidrug efflux pump subunit AcrA (membrane-fusion protein)
MSDIEHAPLLKEPPAAVRSADTRTRGARAVAARPSKRAWQVARATARPGRMAALPAAPAGLGHRPAGGQLCPERVRVDTVAQQPGMLHVTLPATTLGFVEANIDARASGYVVRRYVDIGDHVRAGQLLAEITAPEVEDQVAQYRNSVQAAQAMIRQNQAQRASTDVTSRRISILAKDGWMPQEQRDTDWYAYQAQTHATTAAEYNAAANEQQLKYYDQQKSYQQSWHHSAE